MKTVLKYRQILKLIGTVFYFFSVGLGFSQAPVKDSLIIIGKRYEIQSKILNEKRVYSVYLPTSYQRNQNQKYIVAYVLDGEKSKFLEVVGIAQSMHSSFNLKLQIPELIIVSIENTQRTRDFTPTNSKNYLDRDDIEAFSSSGQANNFMRFIGEELIPEMDRSFRTLSQRMIIGHSMGGLFALHCLLEKPSLFNYYLLIDPSWFWDRNYIGKRAKQVITQRSELKARVYIALANNLQDDKRHYQWGMEFFNFLKDSKLPGLSVQCKYFEDEKHLTVPVPATYYGLRFIFEPYEIDMNQVMQNPNILANYQAKAQRELFLDTKPDERFVNTIGYVALHDRQTPDIAITIFEINAANYPKSLNVWDSLADAYLVKGNKEKAKMCYEKILALSPNDANAKKNLEALNKN